MASLRKKGKYGTYESAMKADASERSRPDLTESVAQIKRGLEGKIQRIKAGTLDPREAGAWKRNEFRSASTLKTYVRGLEAKGCVEGHVDGVHTRLTWFLEETKSPGCPNFDPRWLDTALKTLRDAGKSDRTVSHYCAASSRSLAGQKRTGGPGRICWLILRGRRS